MTGHASSSLPHHRKPYLRNILLATILIGSGVLFVMIKLGKPAFLPIPESVLDWITALGSIYGGIFILIKTFERHVIAF